uniref:Uncharacterized protein n=1 Tax=Globisporangium ultimum (strain ATCC 200006 / CBS 805.95 / DAOM BR144) TaxID=431595 RepID=K3X2G9_GLOUD
METRNTCYYREFTRKLLRLDEYDAMFDGVCFLAQHGAIEYAQGCFSSAHASQRPQNEDDDAPFDPLQFLRAFDQITRRAVQEEARAHQQYLNDAHTVKPTASTASVDGNAAWTPAFHVDGVVFQVVLATFTSVCAVAPGKSHGLIAEKLPFGLLLVRFAWPQSMEHVFPVVERCCASLRY